MSEPRIRPATGADLAPVERVVREAYRVYIPRIGKPPGPMLDDYAARIREGSVSVLEAGNGAVAGIIILLPEPGFLFLLNVAVHPDFQGRSFGSLLMAFAEQETRERGLGEIRLYTHAKMTENIAMYARMGFVETGRAQEEGYDRVFMAKTVV